MHARHLIIVGDSAFAEIAYEYFTHDSPYQVVAFCVDREFLTRDSLFGLPVVPMDEIEVRFPPEGHSFYAALVYTQLNRLRTRLYQSMKSRGYAPASYVSSSAFVWQNVQLGEHCFIFEDNTIQPFCRIGENVVLWSGNHIGHHSRVADNCFISSHVVVSGYCEIGQNCFIGVNATLGNNVSVGADCLVGAGALITSNVEDNSLLKGHRTSAAPGARERFGVEK
jgi:sugar O-acyltransferase (sialic acid O-acetyltransferase NeuD family)